MPTEMIAAEPAGDWARVRSSDEIALSENDRSRLYAFPHSGQQSARAQVLLKLGEGWALEAAP